MDQYEGREEGFPPSKTTLFGEYESQTKAQRTCHNWWFPPSLHTHEYFPAIVSAPMELGIKKKWHSPTRRKDFGENSDILECLRSLATQRDFASGDLTEFGQSYGCSQTDNTYGRHMDNIVDETFYNREFLPLQGLTGTVPNYVSVQSDLSKDMGINFKERQHFATERTHYMQNLNGSVVSRLSLQSGLSKDIGIDFKERQHRGRKSVPQCPAGGNGCVVVEERIPTLQISHCAELLPEGIPGSPHHSRATDGFRHTYSQGNFA